MEKVMIRLRMGAHDVHYGGELVDGAKMLQLFGDVATELLIRNDGDEGLFAGYEKVEFLAPVFAGDYIEASGEIVNIGSNFEISVGDTLNKIKEIMNSDVEFITDDQRLRPGKSEVFRLWCDNTKINKLTGFKPEHSIDHGLKATIDWFINPANLSKYKADIYNV